MPNLLHPYDPPDPPRQPQVIVVSHSLAVSPHARMKSGGWFGRAFAATSGVLLAILAFNVALAIVVLFVFVLFLEYGRSQRYQSPAKAVPAARR